VNVQEADQMLALFKRLAQNAAADPETAQQVRSALAESGLLGVFGTGETLDVVELLDVGGEEALRTRLHQLTLSELKQIISVRQYDRDQESARWRSPNKFIDLIVIRAAAQLEQELARQKATIGPSWIL